MMKNKMMRAASILLVAVLLSTCAISGTFAKYVTTASGTDTARVAKWGIQMNSSGESTFVDKYEMKADNSKNSVVGTAAADVVAPGTSGSATYTITGTPETAYQITFKAENVQDVFLGAGVYTYTSTGMTYDPSMSQTVSEEYYPIKYNYVIKTNNGTVTTTGAAYDVDVVDGKKTYTVATDYNTLGEALAALGKTTISFAADKDKPCDVTIELTWDWAFDQTSTESNANAYDTILGDLAAKKAGADVDLNTTATEVNGDYSLTVAYTLKMTATQID